MFNSPSPSQTATSIPKAPAPGSIPQPRDNGLPGEMVPDWNNIGLFTAGIAVGAILGAAVALLFAPASGGETRHRIAGASEMSAGKTISGTSWPRSWSAPPSSRRKK